MTSIFLLLAEMALAAHLTFIAWVIFGALWTRGRPAASALHVACLIYAILIELGPWPCLLTLAENSFEAQGGLTPYRGPFLLHYLDALVYANVSAALLTAGGVAVCAANLGVYAWRWARWRAHRQA